MERRWRLYLDTSVLGGCFDANQGWAEDSRRVLDAVLNNVVQICFTDTLVRELELAPAHVRELWNSLPSESLEHVPLTQEIEALSAAYLNSGVVGKASIDDALHVAAATAARADAIVSWNFKHIVRLDRIKGYNQVNLSLGYGILTIISPKEVRFNE